MIKSIDFPKELLKKIGKFRRDNFFKQFSPAIVYLVHLGLEYHERMQQDKRPMIFSTPSEQPRLYPSWWSWETTGTDAAHQWYDPNQFTRVDTGYRYG